VDACSAAGRDAAKQLVLPERARRTVWPKAANCKEVEPRLCSRRNCLPRAGGALSHTTANLPRHGQAGVCQNSDCRYYVAVEAERCSP
jgi:hypothetical protein